MAAVDNILLVTAVKLIFTTLLVTGSTGLPKGVKLRHRAAFMRSFWQWSQLPFSSADDVCAFKAALTFIDAVTEIFSALLSGHTLVVFPREVVRNVALFVQVLFYVTSLFYLLKSRSVKGQEVVASNFC